ncbi:MAG TPA: cation-translocating P-type ATPase [Thermoanaerobaculia bacterium]
MALLADELCAHCRLPLPSRPLREELDGIPVGFCCVGCITVFRLIGSAGERGSASWFLAKLGLAAILSGNVMMFQSLLYFGSPQRLGADVVRTTSWIMLGLSLAVYLLLGVPMLRIAIRAARRGRFVLESLIAFGALAAILASARETIRGGTNVYYDSGTMVLVLVVLGQYLDARARQRASEAVQAEVSSAVRFARVKRNQLEVEVPPGQVRTGETVQVRAGEEIPVDGRVTNGLSHVAEPALTGESMPRLVRPGDQVYGGTIALDGALLLEASGESETLAARIARWTARAQQERAPIELLADRWVSRFIPAVVIVAVVSFLGLGLTRGRWDQAALAALSVLVVACPCALGIATPLATTLAIGKAAERGILFRSGAALEALSRVRAIAFDKTGTLTRGRPRVSGIEFRTGTAFEEERVWSYAGAVARTVDHPLTRAVAEYALIRRVRSIDAEEAQAIAGGGVKARVDGHSILLGSLALLKAEGVDTESPSTPRRQDATHVHIAIDGRWTATIALDDIARTEAAATIATLGELGLRTAVLSGDRPAIVTRIGEEIGVDQSDGGLTPREKTGKLADLRARGGLVAMVGDGINDGPALAAADVGIAFGSAADLARQTADVVVLQGELWEIVWIIQLARRTMKVIRQNLTWAFLYNGVAIAMAACGTVRPIVAAAAMVASSLFVVGNSLRLERFQPRKEPPLSALGPTVNPAES